MKQSPAVGHGDCLGAAQDVQFSEQRLDVALDGDFCDGQVRANVVGIAPRVSGTSYVWELRDQARIEDEVSAPPRVARPGPAVA